MNQDNPVDCSRFELAGGKTGILLLHGYTAGTAEVRPMAEFLAARGMSVVAPLLPGHGTSPEDLNTRTWREVAEAAAHELYELQTRCERVYVGGVSMGGLLSLHLGQRCRDIAGLIPMAPALYLRDPLHHLLPLLGALPICVPKSKDLRTCVRDASCGPLVWSYDSTPLRFAAELVRLMRHVRDRLELIECPLLVFHGRFDQAVPVRAARAIVERAASRDAELVLLESSGHCISVDGERQTLFGKVWQWIRAAEEIDRS